MSLCLSEKCKDYGNSWHSDAVRAVCVIGWSDKNYTMCNCWSDIGCHHSDVKNEFVLQNVLSYVCLNCLIKKGNDFNNSMFSVHDQVEISGDTRDNFKTALDVFHVDIIIYHI